jgi:dimeric dUTPase (all-alpha-NTP-PPase superfamily)
MATIPDMKIAAGFDDRLGRMFDLQLQMQWKTFGKNPYSLEGEERIQFIKDMKLALDDEMAEFLAEIGWKPWATSRHINPEAKGELVDAFHFFMNLCMAVGMTPEELFEKYLEKRERNIKRQEEGYDGIKGKCPRCKRAFDDIAKAQGLDDEVGMMLFRLQDGTDICPQCVTSQDTMRNQDGTDVE